MSYTNIFSANTKIQSGQVNTNFRQAVMSINRQDNTTNSTVSDVRVCFGWGFKTGDTTSQMAETVTFPITYDAAPVVLVTDCGYITGSATAITSFDSNNGTGNNLSTTACRQITTTNFVVCRTMHTNTFGSNADFGYTWLAIGSVA